MTPLPERAPGDGPRGGPCGAAMRPPRPDAPAPALPAIPGIVLRADAGGHPRTRLGPRLRLDRVVDDRAEIDDGDLQDHHQEDDFPDRVRAHEVSLPGLDASNLWIWEYP